MTLAACTQFVTQRPFICNISQEPVLFKNSTYTAYRKHLDNIIKMNKQLLQDLR
jgi:hypothetical protein